MIDAVIAKLEALGYKFERDVNDIEKITEPIREKSFFLSDISVNPKGSAFFGIRNTSPIKSTVTALQLNFVDRNDTTTIGEYIKDCRALLLSAINLDRVKFPAVKLIEVTGSRVIPNERWYVYAVNIEYTEV